jgi:molecular chaperone GrpE
MNDRPSNSDLEVDDTSENPEDQPLDELEQCRAELAAARAEAQENLDSLLRARADLDNERKRNLRKVEEAHKFGVERLLSSLVPVIDSMELGMSAAETASDAESVVQGVRLTLQQLLSVLGEYGIETIDPIGEVFEPNQHEAVATAPSDELESGRICEVHQKGYILHGRVVRPARVVVVE